MNSEFDPHLFFDEEAEQAVLGAGMYDPDAVRRAAAILPGGPGDFLRHSHRVIWQVLADLVEQGKSTDPITLRDELGRRGELDKLGRDGPLYLHTLQASALPGVPIENHARIVAELAERRTLLQAFEHGAQQLRNPAYDLEDVRAKLRARLDEAALTADDLVQRRYEREVEAEARKLRVREDASRRVRQERTAALEEPELITLDDFLAVEDEPTLYRIQGLWPVGGRILPAAQFKAGKTTLIGNLVRALVDKEDFLGAFPVTPPDGRIVIIDNELDQRMLRRWLREQNITNTGRVAILSLRGKVGTFDILDPDTRARWANKIRAAEGSIVILDCLRPVLDALGLDENRDAGRFLVAFDTLLAEAGASEAAIVHHMGHAGERSRGDSRLLDWPDVTWRLVREKGDDGETDPSAARYFSAYGRDVNVPEGLLEYDPTDRRLSLVGGSRRDAKASEVLPDLYDYLRAHPGASKNSIEKALVPRLHVQKDIRKALAAALAAGKVDVVKGARNADLHTLAAGIDKSQFVSSSAPRQRGHSDFVSSSIDDELKSRGGEELPRDEVTARYSKDGEIGQCDVCGNDMVIIRGHTSHPTCGERAR
ncbi:AAA family ATPase [Streptosporangium canum]